MNNPSFWRGKRVFITGHTGFKGCWLCKTLETAGAVLTGYALEAPASPNLYDICKPEISSVIGDIRDYDLLLGAVSAARPEIVVHMAAQPLVLEAYRAPRYTYDVNVMGTVNLLECVRSCDSVRSVLNVTTDKVYLNREREAGYREDEQLNGYDPYSNSKSCSELVTSAYRGSFLDGAGVAVSTARSGNVIGGGDFSADRLVPDCARALSRGEVIKIRNPHSVRPYQHVLDTVFAYLEIAERQYEDSSYSGAYNIGPGERDCAASGEIATIFCGQWGEGARWEYAAADTPHESGTLRLDCARIERMLGWTPRWETDRAVKEAALWYKAFFAGEDTNEIMLRQIREFSDEGFIDCQKRNT